MRAQTKLDVDHSGVRCNGFWVLQKERPSKICVRGLMNRGEFQERRTQSGALKDA